MFFLLRIKPRRYRKRRISAYVSKSSFFCITGTSTLFKSRHKIFFLSITSLFLPNKNVPYLDYSYRVVYFPLDQQPLKKE